MTDLSATIAPKSDQLNADDLIAGPRTIVITKVSASPSSPEQPVNVFFEGDNGKPYKPCKSMRRVMVAAWGADGNQYAGRAMTLYRDPSVRFGGIEVGGIRISHMSHIDRELVMALTASRAKRAPYTVKPLKTQPPTANQSKPDQEMEPSKYWIGKDAYASGAEWLAAFEARIKPEHAAAFNARHGQAIALLADDGDDYARQVLGKLDAMLANGGGNE